MAKRFKSYKRALQLIKDPTAAADVDPTLDKKSPLYLYFTRDTRTITYDREEASKPKSLLEVSIKPFGAAPDTTALAIVDFSQRVSDTTALAQVKTACNHTETDKAAHARRSGFKPAKATIFIPLPDSQQSATKETSKITGVKYNPVEGASYTFPYGQKTGAIYESAVRALIQAEVDKPELATATVSYKSEVY